MITEAAPGPEKRTSSQIERLMALEKLVELLGSQKRAAEAILVDPSSFRRKLRGDREVSAFEMKLAGDELFRLGNQMLEYAERIRSVHA